MVHTYQNLNIICRIIIALLLMTPLSGCSVLSNRFSFFNVRTDHIKESIHMDSGAQSWPSYSEKEIKRQYLLARHFQKQDKHEIAVEEFLKVLKMDPQYANAYNALGVSYDQLKNYDAAQEAYQAAIKLDPALDHVYNNIGYSYLLSGHLEESLTAFEKAIELNKNKRTYQNNRSLVIAKLYPKYQPDQDTYEQLQGHLAKKVETASGEDHEVFYSVQVGAYYDLENAKRIWQKALDMGYDSSYITKVEGKRPYYRIRLGQFNNEQYADEIARTIKEGYFDKAFTVISHYPLRVFHDNPTGASSGMEIQQPAEGNKAGIEISNGNGVYRMAQKVGRYLSNLGFRITKVSNASNFDYKKTLIYYHPGFHDSAQQLLKEISGFPDSDQLVESQKIKNNIMVIIGRDMVPFKENFLEPLAKVEPGMYTSVMAQTLNRCFILHGI